MGYSNGIGSFAASFDDRGTYHMGHLTGYVGYKGEGNFEITDLKYVPGMRRKIFLNKIS